MSLPLRQVAGMDDVGSFSDAFQFNSIKKVQSPYIYCIRAEMDVNHLQISTSGSFPSHKILSSSRSLWKGTCRTIRHLFRFVWSDVMLRDVFQIPLVPNEKHRLLLRPHKRKQDDVANAFRASEHHDESVDSQPHAACGGHSVTEGVEEIFIDFLLLRFVTYLMREILRLNVGVVELCIAGGVF